MLWSAAQLLPPSTRSLWLSGWHRRIFWRTRVSPPQPSTLEIT